MKKTVLLLCIAAVLITACRKRDVGKKSDEQAAPSIPVAIKAAAADPAANPENPADSLGRLHNMLLDSLRSYLASGGDTSFGKQQAYLHQLLLDTRGVSVKQQKPDFVFALVAAIRADYKKVLDKYGIAPAAKQYLISLTELLKATTGKETYMQLKNKIVLLESQVAADPTLNKKERATVFAACSIARYSIYHWVVLNGKVNEPMETNGLFKRILLGIVAGIGDCLAGGFFMFIEESAYEVFESAATASAAAWFGMMGAYN